MKFIIENWERIIFSLLGFCFVSFSIYFLSCGKLTEAIATFGMFFVSIVLSSLSRFKRIKGLGIEAELWEDKKKEAASLIQRLKKVVEIYSKEILITRAMSGRLGPHEGWKSHWKLFEELTTGHKELGQSIDFSDIKAKFEAVFIFDIVMHQIEPLSKSISQGKQIARRKLENEFGSPITDVDGYGKKSKILGSVNTGIKDAYQVSLESNLAKKTVEMSLLSKKILSETFDVDIELDRNAISVLTNISDQWQAGKIEITDEMITLASSQ